MSGSILDLKFLIKNFFLICRLIRALADCEIVHNG